MQQKRGWRLFIFFGSVYLVLGTSVEHWEAKHSDISSLISPQLQWPLHNFCKTTGASLRHRKVLLERRSSSISSRAERKSSSSFLFSSTLKAKKPPLLCNKAKEDSVVCLVGALWQLRMYLLVLFYPQMSRTPDMGVCSRSRGKHK